MFTETDYQNLRWQMVEQQLRARDIYDRRVLAAMERVLRHQFVPDTYRHLAYQDGPLPIGEGQTISQPYIVAFMTQLLELRGNETVLEVGTGCGYQAAVLGELARYVYSLERFARLADRAAETLSRLGYTNVDIHVGDGSQGLVDMGPFDAIIVTAAAPSIPGPLCSQLHPETGRLVLPVGSQQNQTLQIVRRQQERFKVEQSIGVRFVPLIGRYGFKDESETSNSGSSTQA